MHWTPIAKDCPIWTADYRIPSLPCRSSAVALPGGGYAIFSPGAAVVESFARDLGGPVHFLIVPNSYHASGVPAWMQRFGQARVATSAGAAGRVASKGVALTATLDDVRARLPAGVALLELPGTRIGEVWLTASTAEGTAWFVGDTFFNLERTSRRPLVRLMSRVLRSGPGLAISGLMKWIGVSDRRALRAWLLDRLGHDQPRLLVPAHGGIVRSATLATMIESLVTRRL